MTKVIMYFKFPFLSRRVRLERTLLVPITGTQPSVPSWACREMHGCRRAVPTQAGAAVALRLQQGADSQGEGRCVWPGHRRSHEAQTPSAGTRVRASLWVLAGPDPGEQGSPSVLRVRLYSQAIFGLPVPCARVLVRAL